MNAKITNWLEGRRDYKAGVDLLKELDAKHKNLVVLNLGESSLTRPILESSLKELNESFASSEPVYKEKGSKPMQRVSRPKADTYQFGQFIDIEVLPDELKPEVEHMANVVRKAKLLKGKLNPKAHQKHNQPILIELHRLLKSYTAALLKINAWETKGELPGDKLQDDERSKIFAMIKEYKANSNYISKYNSKGKSFADEIERRKNRNEYIEACIDANRLI